MSEYGYEDYGVDEGVDADAIAQAAAERVAQVVAPHLQQQQETINALQAMAFAQTQKNVYEQQQEEARVIKEAQELARREVGASAWDQNKHHLADYLEHNEELMPDSRLGSVEATKDGLVTAFRMLQQDAAREAAQRNADLADKHVEQMRGAIAGSRYWESPELRKAQG